MRETRIRRLPAEPFYVPPDFTDADRKLSADMQAYWTNFAKTGDPNGEGLPAWPRFDGKSRQYLEFVGDATIKLNRNQRREFCALK